MHRWPPHVYMALTVVQACMCDDAEGVTTRGRHNVGLSCFSCLHVPFKYLVTLLASWGAQEFDTLVVDSVLHAACTSCCTFFLWHTYACMHVLESQTWGIIHACCGTACRLRSCVLAHTCDRDALFVDLTTSMPSHVIAADLAGCTARQMVS
jgi:hypothetical protein